MAGKVTRDHHNLRRNLNLNDNYISNDGGDEGLSITDAGVVSTSGALTVGGDFTVNGTTTTVNSTTLQIDDKMIELAHSPSGSEGDDSAVDGGGFTLKSSDSDKTILWTNSSDQWHYNQGINITSGNLVVAGDILIDADDKALVLGADQDASIFSDAVGDIYFVSGQDYSPAGADTEGWIKMDIGTSAESWLGIYGGEGGDSTLGLYPDQSEDNADTWNLVGDTSGNFKVQTYSTGSWVDHFKLDANSRISLSNNDSGGTGGTDSTTGNTVM